jgi:hypothetical protein
MNFSKNYLMCRAKVGEIYKNTDCENHDFWVACKEPSLQTVLSMMDEAYLQGEESIEIPVVKTHFVNMQGGWLTKTQVRETKHTRFGCCVMTRDIETSIKIAWGE